MVDTAGIVTKPTDKAMNTITMLIFITIQVAHTNSLKLTHTQILQQKDTNKNTSTFILERNCCVLLLPTAALTPNRTFLYILYKHDK